MAISSLFKTRVSPAEPLDGSSSDESEVLTSDFLTVQSLTNFGAMTGGITAAWHALVRLDADIFSTLWWPYAFAAVFGLVSILISSDALKKDGKWSAGAISSAVFVAIINSLVLASAVVGTGIVVQVSAP